MENTQPTRFYPALDIVLLMEVLAVNPYAREKNSSDWEGITANINTRLSGKKVSMRGCKDRVKTLLKAHHQAEMASLKASGTDEEYTERNRLLTHVDELVTEAERAKTEKKGAESEERKKEEQGKDIREAAMSSLKRTGENTDGVSKRAKMSARTSLPDYLEKMREKNEREAEIRVEQLKLERERFELEKKEREQRLERDNMTMEIIRQLIAQKKES